MAAEKYTIERVLAALTELTGRGHIIKENFIRDCGISERTFTRFIADLKIYLSVKYDRENDWYTIDRTKKEARTEMLDHYKKLMIKDDFLFFYAFVRSMINSKYFFPPYGTERLTSSEPRDYAKVLQILEELTDHRQRKLYKKIDYYVSGHYHLGNRPHYKEVCEKIISSMETENLLEYRYFRNTVKVQPLKLVYYNGKWYLAALYHGSDKKRGDSYNTVRIYKVAHIKNSRLLKGEYFTSDVPDYSFTESFGIYMDEDIKRAVINIYGTAADDATELVWHQKQFTTVEKDSKGRKYVQIRIDYPENGSVELISRALSFGTSAEIVSPPALRKQWQDKIREMAEKFGE
ncbi:MAG: WYL domain-containing protein [Candidatus Delongbacteria bacterium]|nr:WYL domain-containing protein [Candidatus Delongbacteria bacterium]